MQFVMELSNPTLNYRSYAEIPAFLFMTLSICFLFSYFEVGSPTISPTT